VSTRSSHGHRWRELSTLVREPMARLVLFLALIRVVAITWGLPASDGWDNDGIAPRDVYPGLALTLIPGSFYTYPPLQLLVLAILGAPVVLVALVRAPSLVLSDVIAEALAPSYMTSLALLARGTSLVMSLGIVLGLARMTEEFRALTLGVGPAKTPPSWDARVRQAVLGPFEDPRVRRAGLVAATLAGLSPAMTYYAKTSNLDVPYLFWAVLSLVQLARAIARTEPRRLVWALVFAALAVSTKDQAYAMFVLAVPTMLALWIGLDQALRNRRCEAVRHVVVGIVVASMVLATIDAAIVNPEGFAARVRFLTGSASQDFVEYSRDARGRWAIVVDAARSFHLQGPKLLAPLFALGLGWGLWEVRRAPVERRFRLLLLGVLPGLVAVSFTVAFNFVSLRTNARFLLPQAAMFSVYGALGIEALAASSNRIFRGLGRVVFLLGFGLGLHASLSVDVNLLCDPRYDTEAWLRAHVGPNDLIETYGLNVYLPRFPDGARVVRVGPEAVEGRSPLRNVTEVSAPFGAAPSRGARFIVVSTAWAWRYALPPGSSLEPGRRLAPGHEKSAAEADANAWFRSLDSGNAGYTLVHESRYDAERWFPVFDIHGTSARTVRIYAR
jgi:hypothetical protein